MPSNTYTTPSSANGPLSGGWSVTKLQRSSPVATSSAWSTPSSLDAYASSPTTETLSGTAPFAWNRQRSTGDPVGPSDPSPRWAASPLNVAQSEGTVTTIGRSSSRAPTMRRHQREHDQQHRGRQEGQSRPRPRPRWRPDPAPGGWEVELGRELEVQAVGEPRVGSHRALGGSQALGKSVVVHRSISS